MTTTPKRTKLQTTRDKGHNAIHSVVGWLSLPIVWTASIASAIVKVFITHGRIIGGSFLIVASAAICIDNYYIILSRDSLTSILSGGLGAIDPFYFVVATLTWVLVEYVQGKALKARQQAKETAQVVGMPSTKGTILLGFVATVLEGLSLVFGVWQRGGLSLITLIIATVGLFGFKIGLNWIEGGK